METIKKRKAPLSQREIRTVVAKIHNEGITGNSFETTLCQYILEICGIDYNCPTAIFTPFPDVVKHRVNLVSDDKLNANIKYWKERFFED